MKKAIAAFLLIAALVWWWTDPSLSVVNGTTTIGYQVHYTGGAGRRERLPLLVALHGNGDRAGHFFATALDQVQAPARVVLLKGPLSYGGGRAWPMEANAVVEHGRAVREAVVRLANDYPTSGKPVLFGFSGGAMMAYYQAAAFGDSYAHIFPISGDLPVEPETWAEGSTSTCASVHAYHGTRDDLISIQRGRAAAETLRAHGVQLEWTEFDGGHLGLFTNAKPQISAALERRLRELRLNGIVEAE